MEINITNAIAHEVLEVIAHRKSIRAFKSEPIEQDKINQILEAARWSFSSGNEQPWRFIVAHAGSVQWQLLFDHLAEGNQTWCKYVPVFVVTLAKKTTSKGNPYKHAWHDTGAATMLMAIQATGLGMQLHPMGGFKAAELSSALAIDEAYDLVCISALGYPNDDLSALNERQQAGEITRSNRMPIEQLLINI
ncbi:MAG: nitroreductase family protein [Bacteroidia bacterium]|jgi:nitroreductase|nr:nitroreductase family protein [Bacteroidia bacterium]